MALESKDIEFLLQNSLDSIQCAECKIEVTNSSERYDAKLIFESYSDQLMHLKALKGLDFSTHEENGKMYVNYQIETSEFDKNSYNLIFRFVKTAKGYKFSGMIVT